VKVLLLDVGLLQTGDAADFLIVDSLTDFTIQSTWINGEKVAECGRSLITHQPAAVINNFHATPINPDALRVPASGAFMRVIEASDGALITGHSLCRASVHNGAMVSDCERDLLKIIVINRYRTQPPAIGFIRGFGLKKGAIASTVAHDSHNIIAIGTSDDELCRAVNALIANNGGIIATDGANMAELPLPIAGLMSERDGYQVASDYSAINCFAAGLGCSMRAPFMTLSFMALLVIPSLKISDRGLFDGEQFAFTPLIKTENEHHEPSD